ncbi:GTPase [Tunturiibacter gelidiferens]|uniref:GTPase n=1 Tax=Tunturiibacter gelidiferens TaxID=3069689 RepID=UPI003D9B11EF
MAIVGRPNVGKSSLFNRLIQRDRAIVTSTPGTTRDLVTERVSLEGIPLELIDTAGLRYSIDEAESIGIAKSREAMSEADVVLLVLDATAPPHEEDATAVATLAGRPFLIVINKQDLGHRESQEPGLQAVETSALTGSGIPELRRAILSLVTKEIPNAETAVLTNHRQQRSVSDALVALNRARQAVTAIIPHEMILLDLYEGLRALDAFTGSTTSDDILNLIFSKFCIGK